MIFTNEEIELLREVLESKKKQYEATLLKLGADQTKGENRSADKRARRFNSTPGPLPPAEDQERTQKICRAIQKFGGTGVHISKIATEVQLRKDALHAWMSRRIDRPECPWKNGRTKSEYSLKGN